MTGCDTTGQVGNLAKPFRSFDAAFNAIKGLQEATIFLYPGHYTVGSITLEGISTPEPVIYNLYDAAGLGRLTPRIFIIGNSVENTRLDVTTTIVTNTVMLWFRDLTIAAINMPVIKASNSIIDFSNCYIQSTYNESSDGGLNYIVYTTGTFLRVCGGGFSLISTPGNPTNIIMSYSDFVCTLLYTRFDHNAYAQNTVNIPTTITTVGGHGEIDVYYTETYLIEPGNDEYSTVSVVYLDGPARVTLQDTSMFAFTATSPVPAGQLFRFCDPTSVISPDNVINVVNQAISGLSNFVKVDHTLPPGSYQNMSWDTETIPNIGFQVNRVGAVRANGLCLTTNIVSSSSYTPNDGDYLIYYTGSGTINLTDSTSNGNPVNNGRVIVVYNGGSSPIVVIGYTIQPNTATTFQYVNSVGWIKTS